MTSVERNEPDAVAPADSAWSASGSPLLDVTDDAFLGGKLRILQPRTAYRAGLDAVLLAAAVPDCQGAPVDILDAGAGVGVVGLAIAHRIAAARITLVEIAPALASLARENARRNAMADRIEIVEADISRGGAAFAPGLYPALQASRFAHVVANPPYQVDGRASPSPNPLKANAHAMPPVDLDAWLRFLAAAAMADGTATVIHRADALPELLEALGNRFGALKILPIHARAGKPASRIVVQGRKGSRAPLTLLPGLILHGEGHAFRPPVDAILRDGQSLNW